MGLKEVENMFLMVFISFTPLAAGKTLADVAIETHPTRAHSYGRTVAAPAVSVQCRDAESISLSTQQVGQCV